MKNLTDIFLKARSGVYKDTSENRRLHRVGQKYGESKQSEDDEKDKKEVDPAKELAAVNKVISAIAAGKINLPNQEVVKLYEKRRKLEEAKAQAEKINAGVKANKEKGNVKEVKETNEKINEASERTKKYGESSLQKFSEFLINDVKKMINIDLKSAIEGSSRKMGGGIIVDLTKLSRNDNSSVRQYLSKKGIKTLEWDAKRTYILYKDFEASERKKKYGDMNVEEAKKELLGKDLTITDIETGKTRTEKITSILEGNVRGHENVMARVEGGGTYPIKHIDTGKEWKAWKLNLNSPSLNKEAKSTETSEKKDSLSKESLNNSGDGSEIKITNAQTGNPVISYTKKNGQWFAENSMTRGEVKSTPEQMMRTLEGYNRKLYVRKMNLLSDSKETKSEQVKQEKEKVDFKGSDKTGGNEEKETFTRVKFDDLPNSGKVNLKKYLSDKVKRTADENLGILSKVSTENLKKMEAGLVKEFNSQFDDLPKSRRAEKLYSIMKVKAELAQRGNKG